MRARVALAVVLVAAVAALAGCLAHTGPTPVSPSDVDAADAAPNGTPATPAVSPDVPGTIETPGSVYTVDGPSVHETLVRNGSFQFYQTYYPAGFATGSYQEGLELTEHIPVGVPTRLNVTLDYDQDVFNFVDAALSAPGAEVYAVGSTTDFDEGVVWLDATVARLDPDARVIVRAEGILPDDGSSEYRLDVSIRGHTGIVQPWTPTRIQVPPEADGFRLGFDDAQGSFQAMIWDPTDRFLGHRTVSADPGSPDNVTVRLGPDRPSGDYAVLVKDVELPPDHTHTADTPHHHHGVVATTLNETADARMEPLGMTYRYGANVTVGSGDTARWNPHASKAPIQAGMVASPSKSFVTVNPSTLSGSLRTAGDPVVAFSGDGFLLGFGGYAWISPIADENLDEGSYRATFTNDGGTTLKATHFFGFYER